MTMSISRAGPCRIKLWILVLGWILQGVSSQGTCFQTKSELMDAISQYMQDTSSGSAVAVKYGYPIGTWCVSQITDFAALFASLQSFNEDLDGWDTSQVTTMERMFEGARTFSGEIRNWDVSSVTTFRSMFQQATKFAGDLSNWNTANALDMSFMFYDATSLQTDLSQWDVSKVTTMESFASAAGFLNTLIDSWDVSSCTNFDNMFARGAGFDKNLCAWGGRINPAASVENMFGMADTTSSRCPAPQNPDLTAIPPGPFCHSCVEGEDGSSGSGGGSGSDGAGGADGAGGGGSVDVNGSRSGAMSAIVRGRHGWLLHFFPLFSICMALSS